MDIVTILVFIILAIVVYLILKFIVSPLIRIAISLATILILIYIFSHFFAFNPETAFGPYGKFLDIKNWPYANILTNFIDKYINQAIDLFKYLTGNLTKAK